MPSAPYPYIDVAADVGYVACTTGINTREALSNSEVIDRAVQSNAKHEVNTVNSTLVEACSWGGTWARQWPGTQTSNTSLPPGRYVLLDADACGAFQRTATPIGYASFRPRSTSLPAAGS